MALIATRYNKGFTLIEAIIAVFILTVTMLWSLQGLMNVDQSVSNNVIREEAVKLGQELLNDARSTPYGSLAFVNDTVNITRQIASYDITFAVGRLIQAAVPGVSISVAYTIQWDGGNHSYVARTVVSNK